jgi:hypothetical protein
MDVTGDLDKSIIKCSFGEKPHQNGFKTNKKECEKIRATSFKICVKWNREMKQCLEVAHVDQGRILLYFDFFSG